MRHEEEQEEEEERGALLVHHFCAQQPDAVAAQEKLLHALIAGQIGHCEGGVALALHVAVLQYLRRAACELEEEQVEGCEEVRM